MKKVKENVISYTIDKAIFGDFAILVNNGEVVVKAPWYFSKQRIQDAHKRKQKLDHKEVKRDGRSIYYTIVQKYWELIMQ